MAQNKETGMKCQEIIDCLERLSPPGYACDWDNVGLLVGRRDKNVSKVMVALDATKEVIQQAVEQQVDMLITHHPMIFSSLKRINEDDFMGLKIPLPPIEKQKQIIAGISKLRARIQELENRSFDYNKIAKAQFEEAVFGEA